MNNRHYQRDVATTLATHFLLSNLHTAMITSDTFITDTLVFTTITFIVLGRTKNALTEQTITLRLVGAVVNSFWLQHFAVRILQNLFR